ncbi:hypothetical protein Acsp04_37370 [Actinomadura sp. NBRC 104425]|uniref:hypothetical protein n=1 Tax=Actinomadura sp. NBRC 104425 TaxID=3032204 RepID=UPI0024A20CDC|nr:hypothetical protein [Actinomadura sp. NBRC 104425]GLZ13502.1 hypothetical protein Acsp04_37370 [Actinomadura sp. NBRC 104425]
MLSRSAGSPLVLGLAAAAILAAGTPPVLAADDDTPELDVKVTASPDTTAEAGEFLTLKVTVKAEDLKEAEDLNVTVSSVTRTPKDDTILERECFPPDCTIKVGDEQPTTVAKMTAKKSITEKTDVTVKVQVDSPDTEDKLHGTGEETVTFTPLASPSDPPSTESPSPTPTPTKSPTSSPGKGKESSDNEDSKDKDDDNDSGSDSGSSSGSSGSSGSGSSGAGYTPPSPNASFTPPASPGVSLPSIAPPSPSVAPGQSTPTPESRLRNNKAPVAQDLTFEQMASTQVAWLAALLAAFSVLLTQLRLGRRRAAPGAAATARGAAAPKRSKGAHRRPRRGVFGK